MNSEYTIKWSIEDEEYVATCSDYESLSYLAPSPIEALEGLMQIIIQDLMGDE